jgi:hypothetical protein
LRIFVRASSLVGAVTSTLPVDDPVCRARQLPLARWERVQGSFMRVHSAAALISNQYQRIIMNQEKILSNQDKLRAKK